MSEGTKKFKYSSDEASRKAGCSVFDVSRGHGAQTSNEALSVTDRAYKDWWQRKVFTCTCVSTFVEKDVGSASLALSV